MATMNELISEVTSLKHSSEELAEMLLSFVHFLCFHLLILKGEHRSRDSVGGQYG